MVVGSGIYTVIDSFIGLKHYGARLANVAVGRELFEPGPAGLGSTIFDGPVCRQAPTMIVLG
jgi:hypothetical protein